MVPNVGCRRVGSAGLPPLALSAEPRASTTLVSASIFRTEVLLGDAASAAHGNLQ